MAYRVFTLPVHDPGAAETELNGFLASHRVLSVDRRFVEEGERSFWSFCVDFVDARRGSSSSSAAGGTRKRDRTDYREVLNAEDFAVFAKLREIRKAIAHANTSHPRTDLFRTMTFSGRRPNPVCFGAGRQQSIELRSANRNINDGGRARCRKLSRSSWICPTTWPNSSSRRRSMPGCAQLLDRQEKGVPLKDAERREAEGLVELAELLTLLRLRAEGAALKAVKPRRS